MKKTYNLLYVLVMLCFVQQMYGQTPVSRVVGPTNAQINAVFADPSITVTGGTLHSGVRNKQIATFTGGIAAGLEIDEGIFFGTGYVNNLLSLNNALSNGDDVYYDEYGPAPSGGDPTYEDNHLIAINPDSKFDAVVYSFNVKIGPNATKLSITYQFGSEEYPNYVGSENNDIFGFFVSGPGITGVKNLAKLPDNRNTTVNTVNIGTRGSSYSSGGNNFYAFNDDYYINNGHPTNIVNGKLAPNDNSGPKPVAVQFNGLTKAITFDINGLQAGGTYTFKIAIADTGDGQNDAGVFLKKGSLVSMADVKANPDTYTLACGVLTTPSVLANDTYNAPALATTTDVLPSGVSFPAGFTMNADGTISVASTVTAGTYNLTYRICDKALLTNCAEASVSITVPVNKTVTSNPTRNLPVNTALTPAITHTTTAVTGIGAATRLPAGVTAAFASNTITISGTPTVAGTYNYTIPLLGSCGTLNATGTIVVGCNAGTAQVPLTGSTISN